MNKHFPILLLRYHFSSNSFTDEGFLLLSVVCWASLVHDHTRNFLSLASLSCFPNKSSIILGMALLYSSKAAITVIQIKDEKDSYHQEDFRDYSTEMLEKIKDVASNIPTAAILHPPYHLIWRIVHGFLRVHMHEIHNASEGRQKAHFDPKWGHLEWGRKDAKKKKICMQFSCSSERESSSHISQKGTVGARQQAQLVLINKHITRDRKTANNSAFYTVLQKQSFRF